MAVGIQWHSQKEVVSSVGVVIVKKKLDHNTDNGIIKKPSIVLLSNDIPIEKISCGYFHSLFLTRNGDIYWFGFNGCEEKTPKKLTINKCIDIAITFL